MGRRKKTNFEESLSMNNATYEQYFNRLMELSISMFEWKNLPSTCDVRYLELALFMNGSAVFFQDDVLEDYVALDVICSGRLDVYGNPV